MAIERGAYRFPLSIQCTLPGDYATADGFQRLLSLLEEWGFSGLELNILKPETVDVERLRDFLAGYGLRMTMLATGATAKAEGLSLSDGDEDGRSRAVARCLQFIDFAARLRAGIIIGFLKGGPGQEPEGAAPRLAASLARIAPEAQAARVPVLIEATNRYESAAANSLEEAAALVAPLENRYLRILADTFHMNIEERDMLAGLERNLAHLGSVHFSDNNRLLPGLGAIDFRPLIAHLQRIGYAGGIGLEGNMRGNMLEDIRLSVEYLAPLLRF